MQTIETQKSGELNMPQHRTTRFTLLGLYACALVLLSLSQPVLADPQVLQSAQRNLATGELKVTSHMQNFIDCIRSRELPRCHVDRAFEEAVALIMSVEAYRRETKVKWDPVKEEIV